MEVGLHVACGGSRRRTLPHRGPTLAPGHHPHPAPLPRLALSLLACISMPKGKMPSMAFAHSTLQSNPARPDLPTTWYLLRTEAFHVEIPFKTRPGAVCVHVCTAAPGSWREPREPWAAEQGPGLCPRAQGGFRQHPQWVTSHGLVRRKP